MKTIRIYDTDAVRIERLCKRYGITEAEVIQNLIDVIRDEIIFDTDGWFGGVVDESIEV